MMALLFASIAEAQPLLDSLPCTATPGPDASQQLYLIGTDRGSPGATLLICGIGPQAARLGCQHLLEICQPTMLVNAGICGSLNDAFSPFGVYRISEVCDGDRCNAPHRIELPRLASDRFNSLPTARLATVQQPVFDRARRQHLAAHADLVDMEGFAVAQFCRTNNVQYCLLKGVSDTAGSTGRAELQRNLSCVSRTVTAIILNQLGHP